MAANCHLITTALLPDCDYPAFNGVEAIFYVANKSEIASYTRNVTTKAVEAITMASTKKFFEYEGKKSTGHNAKADLVKGKVSGMFTHEVSGVLHPKTATGKLQYDKLINSEVVVIVKYKDKGNAGAHKCEVFGIDQGLELAVLSRDQANADNLGAYAFTFKTPDGYHEPKLPATLFVTSEAATDAVIAALIA